MRADDNIGPIKGILIIIFVAVTFTLVIAWFCMEQAEKKSKAEYSEAEPIIVNIQSVNLQSERDGKFILGLGWESDKKAYYVYQITDDGGKKLVKYSAEYVTIYDNLDNGEQPYMDITNRYDIKMYLPKETVTEEYDVDVGKE